MDIAILAGGYGTRLKGIWDRPKCLIPYRGRPLIEFIVNRALDLNPRKVFLLLGHKASEVVEWRERCYLYSDVVPIIETVPSGTASAIRNAFPWIIPPLIVLNGDTIPEYDIKKLFYAPEVSLGPVVVSWCNGVYAGAGVFNCEGIDKIIYSKESDLNIFVNNPAALRVHVTGFIDVGTPETFCELQSQERTIK